MDREKREAYDAIAGFSGNALNPFYDTSYERSQVCGNTSLPLDACIVHLTVPDVVTFIAGVCQRV